MRGKAERTKVESTKSNTPDDPTWPTFIKVHRKHIDPETLDIYELPWVWDNVSEPRYKLALL